MTVLFPEMLKGRGRDPRVASSPTPGNHVPRPTQAHSMPRPPVQSPTHLTLRTPTQRAPLAKPEPEYEVVEFPTDQYVNAKLQPPPPPPPRPPTGEEKCLALYYVLFLSSSSIRA